MAPCTRCGVAEVAARPEGGGGAGWLWADGTIGIVALKQQVEIFSPECGKTLPRVFCSKIEHDQASMSKAKGT